MESNIDNKFCISLQIAKSKRMFQDLKILKMNYNKVGFIYAVTNPGWPENTVKIGLTSNVVSRISTYKASNPFLIQVKRLFLVKNMTTVETQILTCLSDKRLIDPQTKKPRREFLQITLEQLDAILNQNLKEFQPNVCQPLVCPIPIYDWHGQQQQQEQEETIPEPMVTESMEEWLNQQEVNEEALAPNEIPWLTIQESECKEIARRIEEEDVAIKITRQPRLATPASGIIGRAGRKKIPSSLSLEEVICVPRGICFDVNLLAWRVQVNNRKQKLKTKIFYFGKGAPNAIILHKLEQAKKFVSSH